MSTFTFLPPSCCTMRSLTSLRHRGSWRRRVGSRGRGALERQQQPCKLPSPLPSPRGPFALQAHGRTRAACSRSRRSGGAVRCSAAAPPPRPSRRWPCGPPPLPPLRPQLSGLLPASACGTGQRLLAPALLLLPARLLPPAPLLLLPPVLALPPRRQPACGRLAQPLPPAALRLLPPPLGAASQATPQAGAGCAAGQ